MIAVLSMVSMPMHICFLAYVFYVCACTTCILQKVINTTLATAKKKAKEAQNSLSKAGSKGKAKGKELARLKPKM